VITTVANTKVGTMTTAVNSVEITSVDQDELSLDIRVVEEGEAVDALLCSTDNGCDTRRGGDC
jgi:FxLD family lantipeptide